MGCLCEELAGKGGEISPTCIGHLWVFENLQPEELQAVALSALRRRYSRAGSYFDESMPVKACLLSDSISHNMNAEQRLFSQADERVRRCFA